MPKWPHVNSTIGQTFAGSCTLSEYFPSSSFFNGRRLLDVRSVQKSCDMEHWLTSIFDWRCLLLLCRLSRSILFLKITESLMGGTVYLMIALRRHPSVRIVNFDSF